MSEYLLTYLLINYNNNYYSSWSFFVDISERRQHTKEDDGVVMILMNWKVPSINEKTALSAVVVLNQSLVRMDDASYRWMKLESCGSFHNGL